MAVADQLARAGVLGAWLPHHKRSLATNNATCLKASGGVVGSVVAFNNSSSKVWLKLYDKATTPVPATDTSATVLVGSYLLPTNTGGGGFVVPIPENGLVFLSGIGYALVAGEADDDNTAVGLGDAHLNISYR